MTEVKSHVEEFRETIELLISAGWKVTHVWQDLEDPTQNGFNAVKNGITVMVVQAPDGITRSKLVIKQHGSNVASCTSNLPFIGKAFIDTLNWNLQLCKDTIEDIGSYKIYLND